MSSFEKRYKIEAHVADEENSMSACVILSWRIYEGDKPMSSYGILAYEDDIESVIAGLRTQLSVAEEYQRSQPVSAGLAAATAAKDEDTSS